MSQAVACDSQAVAGASKLLKEGCRRALVKIGCTKQSDRLYYEKFSRYGWSHSPETHLTPLKSVRICLLQSATSHLKFAHEQGVTSSGHEGTPAWTKATPSLSRPSHWKTYRPAEARIYHSCVELAIILERTVCIWNSTFKHTAWSTSLSPREAGDAGLAQFDFTRSVFRKKLARAFSRPGMEATAILATKITWWHGNGDCGCSRFKL